MEDGIYKVWKYKKKYLIDDALTLAIKPELIEVLFVQSLLNIANHTPNDKKIF